MKNNLPPGLYSCFKFLLLVAVLQHSSAVHSEESNARQRYIAGVDAFKNKKFNLALDLFLQAERDGYKTARLYYNIGVTYFKLDKYVQSYEALEKANTDPDIAFLVNLNTGLVAHKLGNPDLAKSKFETAYALANNEQQQSLAHYMLNRLGDEYNNLPDIKDLHANVRIAFGYNDNISLTNPLYTLDQTERNDYFSSIYTNLKYNLYKQLQLQTLVYALEYKNINEYDFADLSMLIKLIPFASYNNFDIGVGVTKNYLAGDPLQNIDSLSLGSVYQQSEKSRLSLKYEYKNISSIDDRFDYLSGSLQRIKLNTTFSSGFNITSSYLYEYEFNNRNDQIEMINGLPVFTSHSPNRHKLRFSTSIPINHNQSFIINLELLNSKYNNSNKVVDETILLSIPPPISIDIFPNVKRKDHRHRTNFKWLYRLNNSIKIFIAYDYLRVCKKITSHSWVSRQVPKSNLILAAHHVF